jgi:hypothetical protein
MSYLRSTTTTPTGNLRTKSSSPKLRTSRVCCRARVGEELVARRVVEYGCPFGSGMGSVVLVGGTIKKRSPWRR